jgi:hypothetical protein
MAPDRQSPGTRRETKRAVAKGRRQRKERYREQHLPSGKYHIEYEEIPEDPTLLTVETIPFNTDINDHTFVAMGHDILPRCLELCINSKKKVFAVRRSNKQPIDLNDPETYLDRLGFLIPAGVLTTAIAEFRATNSSLDPLVQSPEIKNPTKDQLRQHVHEQFPKLPPKTVDAIIEQGWDPRHRDRVGFARDLSMALKIQKATWAHIRHSMTNYEQLFRFGFDKDYARGTVVKKCVRILTQARGEVMEMSIYQFREVVDLTKETYVACSRQRKQGLRKQIRLRCSRLNCSSWPPGSAALLRPSSTYGAPQPELSRYPICSCHRRRVLRCRN